MELQVILILVIVAMATDASTVLLLPLDKHSHCLEMSGIGNELIKRGHSVIAYIPSNFNTHSFDNTNIKIIRYQSTERLIQVQKANEKYMIDKTFGGSGSFFGLLSVLFGACKESCEAMLMSTKELKELQSHRVDVALIGAMFGPCDCYYYIPRYLKVPTITEGATIIDDNSGIPLQSNTQPFVMTTYTSKMDLKTRVINTLVTIFCTVFLRSVAPFYSVDAQKLKGYIPDEVLEVSMDKLVKSSVLYLENSDPVIEYPKALYPNHIRVGGVTTKPARPLPEDLERFFSQARSGVIVVSFGSLLKKLPPSLFEKLVQIFSILDYKVVMAYDKDTDKGNVKTLAWLPQNDVLGHANTILFISHCGRNGFYEGLYHGVPVICAPLNGDGFSSAAKVKFHNVGTSIDIVNGVIEEIVHDIRNTLNNKTIARNMKKASAIFHAADFTPQERAANAIEHVLKFGGKHLRPVSADYSILAQTMLDVWITLFLFVMLISYINYRLLRCCFRCICRRKVNKYLKIKTE